MYFPVRILLVLTLKTWVILPEIVFQNGRVLQTSVMHVCKYLKLTKSIK